jgi:hypothetical protein
MMKLTKMFQNMGQFLTEAIGRVFMLTDQDYPEIGVQPFTGELHRKPVKANY